MIGTVQTSGESRRLECHYDHDGGALDYRVTAAVTPYYGQRPRSGARYVLADGRRTCSAAEAAEHIAHYWQAECHFSGRVVADFRAPGPTIHRYQGARKHFPYDG